MGIQMPFPDLCIVPSSEQGDVKDAVSLSTELEDFAYCGSVEAPSGGTRGGAQVREGDDAYLDSYRQCVEQLGARPVLSTFAMHLKVRHSKTKKLVVVGARSPSVIA